MLVAAESVCVFDLRYSLNTQYNQGILSTCTTHSSVWRHALTHKHAHCTEWPGLLSRGSLLRFKWTPPRLANSIYSSLLVFPFIPFFFLFLPLFHFITPFTVSHLSRDIQYVAVSTQTSVMGMGHLWGFLSNYIANSSKFMFRFQAGQDRSKSSLIKPSVKSLSASTSQVSIMVKIMVKLSQKSVKTGPSQSSSLVKSNVKSISRSWRCKSKSGLKSQNNYQFKRN